MQCRKSGKHPAAQEQAEEHHKRTSAGAAGSGESDDRAHDLTENDGKSLSANPDQAGGDELRHSNA